jgi:hypothetical protein
MVVQGGADQCLVPVHAQIRLRPDRSRRVGIFRPRLARAPFLNRSEPGVLVVAERARQISMISILVPRLHARSIIVPVFKASDARRQLVPTAGQICEALVTPAVSQPELLPSPQ